ncbi:hypothetical protein Poli38472_004819 [Pythium oligandrum]|uniref:PrsW family intramembrane metalloprotease n=1 Tax=Pythium oligandrum TaxID=41045 RepID=A0A8K1CBH4_PYTOL|nr:hypothetical protein Poli38472_004819 [Pythium oligandrum]|eukprot:TMW59750.1 hypothetical protein Poli38472_004819 [Pythium oligandrum]
MLSTRTLTALKRVTRKRLALGVCGILLISILFGLAGFFFLFVLLALPVFAFFAHVFQAQSEHGFTDGEIKQLFTTFVAGIVPGSLLAGLLEVLLVPFWILVCFYDQRETLEPQLRQFMEEQDKANAPPHSGRFAELIQSLEIKQTFGYYVFLLALAYIIAGLVEEGIKLWLVQGKCCFNCSKERRWWCDPRHLLYHHLQSPSHDRVVVLAVVAGALGFSFAENAAYTFVLPTFKGRLMTAVLRTAASTPLHCLCGLITGARLARLLGATPGTDAVEVAAATSSWRSKWHVLWPAVAMHGTFDFQIFLLSTWISDEAAEAHPYAYGVLLPAITSVLVLYATWRLSKKEWQALMQSQDGKGIYGQVVADLEAGGELAEDLDGEDSATKQPRSSGRGVLHV